MIGWLISQPNRVNIYILSVYVYICCICFLHCLQLQQYICVIWLAFTQNVSCLRQLSYGTSFRPFTCLLQFNSNCLQLYLVYIAVAMMYIICLNIVENEHISNMLPRKNHLSLTSYITHLGYILFKLINKIANPGLMYRYFKWHCYMNAILAC